jgi:hypothetical protein
VTLEGIEGTYYATAPIEGLGVWTHSHRDFSNVTVSAGATISSDEQSATVTASGAADFVDYQINSKSGNTRPTSSGSISIVDGFSGVGDVSLGDSASSVDVSITMGEGTGSATSSQSVDLPARTDWQLDHTG